MSESQTWLHVGQTSLSTTIAILALVKFFTDVNAPCFKAVNSDMRNLPCSVMGCCFSVAGLNLTCFQV